jgi:hypothetical protein
MYPEDVLYVTVELFVRNFENLPKVMMMEESFLLHELV